MPTPLVMVSLPFKPNFFVLVDGWRWWQGVSCHGGKALKPPALFVGETCRQKRQGIKSLPDCELESVAIQ